MSFNLLDSVKGLFNNDLISQAASNLGETQGGIEKALTGAIPTVLTSLLNHAGTQEGSTGVLNMANQASQSGILNNLGGLMGGGTSDPNSSISGMISNLLGDKFSGITRLISGFSGINETSAASVLGMVAPAALASLGNHASQHKLDATGLSQVLQDQKDSILGSIPPGLNVAGALGHNSLSDMEAKIQAGFASLTQSVKTATSNTVHAAEAAAEKVPSGMRWLLPLILALLLVALLFYFLKSCNHKSDDLAPPTHDTLKAVVKTDTLKAVKVDSLAKISMKVKLPNGTELDAYKGGIEDRLVSFLSTDYKKLGADSLKKIWFDFDNLNFKTGSAELTPESQKQVDNITAILKAFPQVKLKIGGYTDKTGNEETNKKLSQERAVAVKNDLSKSGVGAQITEASGYGSEFAKYDAKAPEADRVKDRHVSVSVRE